MCTCIYACLHDVSKAVAKEAVAPHLGQKLNFTPKTLKFSLNPREKWVIFYLFVQNWLQIVSFCDKVWLDM